MDWNLVIEIGKVVGGSIVAITTVWKVAPKIWAKMVGCIMHEMQVQMNKMSADVSFIVSELKTNGGTSLRDSVIRNEETLGRIEAMTWNNVEVQRARMDNDQQLIFITDENGDITWVNRAYVRHTGRTIDEVRGSGWVNVVHPDSREEVVEAWYDSVKHDREFEMVVHLIDTSGISFKLDVRSYKMTSYEGKTAGFMGIGEVVSG